MSVTVTPLGRVPFAASPLEDGQLLEGEARTDVAALAGWADDELVGIWRCTPGRFADVEEDEAFVVLSGRATIEPEGGEPVDVGPGDLCVLAAGTRTVWTVHETIVKVYCMADGGDGARPATPPEAPAAGAPPVPEMVVEPPGPRSREILERQRAVLYPGLAGGLYPFVAAHKRDWWIEDVDGNRYADLASASGSVPLGACRPDLVEPAVAALRRYGNEDGHALTTELVLPLAERLLALAPAGLTRVDIALNGTEAVETAVKLMRRATGRPLILGFFGQYHGESATGAGLGAERHDLGRGLRVHAPGFVHVPYPNPYRSPFGPPRPGGTGDATVDYLRDHVLFHAVDPGDVAGVVIEPVAGSGGVLSPPDSFWPALVDTCREHGWLLCADEVKTGFGRTGRMFAVERVGVEPDLMCLGKAMGGGVLPIGAVLGSERALGSFDDVETGSTLSWHPAACAAALAVLDALGEDGVLAHVQELERVARRSLARLPERFADVGDVRAVGCFLAVELVADRRTKERAPALQDAVARECVRRGVLADSSTTSFNLQPSLAMPADALERVLGIVEDAIAAAVSR